MDTPNEDIEHMKALIQKVKDGTATDEEASSVEAHLDDVDMVVDSLVEATQEVTS